jgi:hypothetical protein
VPVIVGSSDDVNAHPRFEATQAPVAKTGTVAAGRQPTRLTPG